jgi:hypothetical protein
LLKGALHLSVRVASAPCALIWLLCQVSVGQTTAVEARVSSMSGSVFASGNSVSLHLLVRGDVLSPGDEIDTRGGGTLTVGLSDGSVVIVEPGSRIILKDYQSANSVRELFNILLGRVRVKIDHLGGRPNPYRINSPTASIAVRGTEFSVAVDVPGDTRVIVFEGQVEVTSLSEPNQRILLEPGRGVIVRPNQSILYFTPIVGRDIAQGGVGEGKDHNQENAKNITGEGDGESPRNTAGTYQRFIAGLVQSGQTPFQLRFTAFPDSYLDSLSNPAYATEFRAAEGRIFVIPSFSGSRSLEASSADLASATGRPIDYSLSPQVSFFAPLPGGRTVMGGSVAASRSGSQSFAFDEATGLAGPLFGSGTVGTRSASDSVLTSFVTGSFVVAHQLGETGHTSIGFGLDQVSGRGSLLSLITQADGTGVVSRERIQSNSTVGQTQLKFGVSRDLFGDHKLGITYRYGFVSASDGNRSRLLNDLPQTLDSSTTSGHTSEISVRLRGPLTHRLFYGVEASMLGLRLDDRLRRAASVDSHQRDNTSRFAIGFGLGYAIRPRAILSLDLSAGIDRTRYHRTEDSTGNTLQEQRQSTRFFSAHAAIQADVWRNLFVSGSLLAIRQSLNSTLAVFPDRFGQSLTSSGLFYPSGLTSDRNLSYYSDFGIGWRFSPQLLVQYVISTDYGQTVPSHTLLLRYTFHRGEK